MGHEKVRFMRLVDLWLSLFQHNNFLHKQTFTTSALVCFCCIFYVCVFYARVTFAMSHVTFSTFRVTFPSSYVMLFNVPCYSFFSNVTRSEFLLLRFVVKIFYRVGEKLLFWDPMRILQKTQWQLHGCHICQRSCSNSASEPPRSEHRYPSGSKLIDRSMHTNQLNEKV